LLSWHYLFVLMKISPSFKTSIGEVLSYSGRLPTCYINLFQYKFLEYPMDLKMQKITKNTEKKITLMSPVIPFFLLTSR